MNKNKINIDGFFLLTLFGFRQSKGFVLDQDGGWSVREQFAKTSSTFRVLLLSRGSLGQSVRALRAFPLRVFQRLREGRWQRLRRHQRMRAQQRDLQGRRYLRQHGRLIPLRVSTWSHPGRNA